jgi:RND family efflux transporter MFP subunit
VFILTLLIVTSCAEEDREARRESPVKIKTTTIKKQELSLPIRSSGILSSKTELKLSFKTGGIIREILVDEGESIGAGTVLAQLNLSEIEAEVRKAELAYDKATRDFNRAKNLYADSVVTLEMFQNARTAVELAGSNRKIARFNMEYSTIRAPYNGKLLKRLAEENEMIAPGFPVFLFASTENDWVVRTNLTDRDIIKIGLLDSARVSFDSYPGKPFKAWVSEIGSSADPYTGTYEIELTLAPMNISLYSGFVAKASIYASQTEEYIVIPAHALVEGQGLNARVFVIENDTPRLRNIEILQIIDRGVVIKSGLSANDTLVILGAEYLSEKGEFEIIE